MLVVLYSNQPWTTGTERDPWSYLKYIRSGVCCSLMISSKILAGLIMLLRSDVTPEQARTAADAVLARLDTVYGGKTVLPVRVTDAQIRERILTALAALKYHPAMRELLTKVSGNRNRVYTVAKSMISNKELEVVREGRLVGIKVKS